VVLPNTFQTIENFAFYWAPITSIVIPDSVSYLSLSAFSNNKELDSIVVGVGNTKYDSRDNCNALIETASNTLIQGSNLSIIPNGVTSIRDGAFYSCGRLTSIVIPNSVTNIGDSAFWGCTELISITIPNSVTSIESRAFADCSGLISIIVEKGNKK